MAGRALHFFSIAESAAPRIEPQTKYQTRAIQTGGRENICTGTGGKSLCEVDSSIHLGALVICGNTVPLYRMQTY